MLSHTLSMKEHSKVVDSMGKCCKGPTSSLVTISFIQIHLVKNDNTTLWQISRLCQYGIKSHFTMYYNDKP